MFLPIAVVTVLALAVGLGTVFWGKFPSKELIGSLVPELPSRCKIESTAVNGPGYHVVRTTNRDDGLDVYLASNSKSADDIQQLHVSVVEETDSRVHVKITSADKARWEIPESVIPRPQKANRENPLYKFEYESKPFAFRVVRKGAKRDAVIFDSSANALVFQDQYLQISTKLTQDSSVYGLGEVTASAGMEVPRCMSTYYGSHPFYMNVESNGATHGVLLLNSNGMDVTLTPKNDLTYQVIGGVLDFYFLMGPSPSAVVEQYTALVGRPAMLPSWVLGFHHSRLNYSNVEELQDIATNYEKAQIPLDTLYTDIEYLEGYKNFVFNEDRFPEKQMAKFVKHLHSKDMYWVPILDPVIGASKENNEPYITGLQDNVFLKNPLTGEPILGQGWPGPSVFPDYFHPNTKLWWKKNMLKFYGKTPFDGIWIDMNEIASFCDGDNCRLNPNKQCPEFFNPSNQTTCCLICSPFDKKDKYVYPPYRINNDGEKKDIGHQTIATNVLHYNNIREYDVHNINGLVHSKLTYEILKGRDFNFKRPYVLSRSTFVGSGKYAVHWTGDIFSSWDDLRYSIPGMLNMGIFGIPLIGADICGFIGDTTEELCGRWMQLGAWYPFARNHNIWGPVESIAQEPYLWASVARLSRTVLNMRYRLLPYWYDLMYRAHTKGGMIARPMFVEYPQDQACRKAPVVDRQFFIGSSILVSPFVEEGAVSVRAYFPAGKWYNIYDHSIVTSFGAFKTLKTPFEEMQAHIREGSVVPLQQAALRTKHVRQSPFDLIVTMPSLSSASKDNVIASGKLFLDDGDEAPVGRHATEIEFSATKSSFHSKILRDTYPGASKLPLQSITVLGLDKQPSQVIANNEALKFEYDAKKEKLVIQVPGTRMNEAISIAWK